MTNANMMPDIQQQPPCIHRFADAEETIRATASHIIAAIRAKPDLVLGLATGTTQRPVYDLLVDAVRKGELSFARVKAFVTDDYIGLPANSPAAFSNVMDDVLFDRIDIDQANIFVPDGRAPDIAAEAAHYERLIVENGGIDLQVLGIGRNGHIGFNEPGVDFASRTHEIYLHSRTLEANAGFFADGHIPPSALTMGIGTILDAREIVMIAVGRGKSNAVKAALRGPIATQCPASALRLHDNVAWFVDQDAMPEML